MEFQEAAEKVTQLSKRPDNETLLKLYALYKQGSEGNVMSQRPGLMDFKGRAKWDAWKQLEGLDMKEAQTQYVALVEELVQNDARGE